MRILVLGGTRFIGRAIIERLVASGHELLVVHRGDHEPSDLPSVRHLHTERSRLPRARSEIAAFEPDAAVEVYAMNAADTDAALSALPDDIRLVAISSCDVYRAYDGLHSGRQTDGVPLTETSPLRTRKFVDGSTFENLEVEAGYLARGAAVLRLGAVYGPYDYQRRFEFVLRRLRAGRRRIPIGSGSFLFSKVYVHDVAVAVELALTTDAARGEVFNVAEHPTTGFRLFAEQILAAADAEAELVQVPDDSLPTDLTLTGALPQDLLVDAAKARNVLGWHQTDTDANLRMSVRWHLDHPPREWDPDFTEDDRALARVRP